jgi:hypothetical protein
MNRPAGYHTPINKFLWVSYMSKQISVGYQTLGNNIELEYFCEFETEFENNLGSDSGVHMGLIHKKSRGQKSSATVSLKSSQ